MHIEKYDSMRLLRFAWWALTMLAGFVIAQVYAPHRTLLVVCFMLLFFVPAVLLSFKPKRKE